MKKSTGVTTRRVASPSHAVGKVARMPRALDGEVRIAPGSLSAIGKRIRLGIVCARFNANVTSLLFEGARRQAFLRGVTAERLFVSFVPGAFELALGAQAMVDAGVDAVVCLGAVIRGETSHYDLVANESASGCQRVQLQTGVPVGFGVLTTENLAQALDRCGGAHGHKGEEAVDVALEMAGLLRALDRVDVADASAGASTTKRAR